jgi:hypothetical protein
LFLRPAEASKGILNRISDFLPDAADRRPIAAKNGERARLPRLVKHGCLPESGNLALN